MREVGKRPGTEVSDPAGSSGFAGPDPGKRSLVDALGPAPAPSGAAPAGPLGDTPQVDAQPQPGPAAAPPAGPAAPPPVTLSAAQIADAISFHTLQPWKYTKPVITQIQNGVGVTPTGVMNADTVQAIAARQAATNATRAPNPPLVVDGKAGPRTLPIVAPVGLATDASIDAYTADIGGMKADLTATAAPADRAKKIMVEINARLAAVGVPPITKPVVIDPALNAFTASDWTMTMSGKELADPMVGAATMYHEARHAEQAFRIARMLAGKHHAIDQIAREVPIDASIVPAAIASPLLPGTTEAVEAEGWHDDEVGRPTQAQQKAKADAAIDGFVTAAKAWKADPSPANRARASDAYDAWKAAYISAYRDKPDEFDAFFLGDKVSDKLGSPRRNDFVPLDDAIAQVTK